MIRVLHTSDWHLGQFLYEESRLGEMRAFLAWLSEKMTQVAPDVLVIAGDLFDTFSPGNQALELYFSFLADSVKRLPDLHVVIVAGNHDSPSLIDAPREVLGHMRIHCVGRALPPQEAVLSLSCREGELLLGAVPFLRERDLPSVENSWERSERLNAAFRAYYRQVADAVDARRAQAGQTLPALVTGHLALAQAKLYSDSESELYIGSALGLNADIFPMASFDYVALGHLHRAQCAGGSEKIRYAGAPLAMSFSESAAPKSVTVVDFEGRQVQACRHEIPVFQRLEHLSGSFDELLAALEVRKLAGDSAWLEVDYTDVLPVSDLRGRLEAAAGPQMRILAVNAPALLRAALARSSGDELDALAHLDNEAVFARRLAAEELPMEAEAELWATYREAVASLVESGTLSAE